MKRGLGESERYPSIKIEPEAAKRKVTGAKDHKGGQRRRSIFGRRRRNPFWG